MNQKRKLIVAITMALCSTGASHSVFAQNLGPIDLDNFTVTNELPDNPLPGGELPRITPRSDTGPSLSGKLLTTATRNESSNSTTGQSVLTESQQGSSIISGNQVSDASDDIVFDDANYDGEIYEGVVESTLYEVHTVFGMSALGFERNYGSDRLLSNNFTERGDTLSTGDSDHNKIGGFETYLQCRSSSGVGWEFRYFGLAPSDNTATLGNDPTTVLVGLNNIGESPTAPSVANIFADGNFHALTRDSSIYNFEFNFLRNRPDIQWFNGLLGNVETMVGLRYIDFDESLEYASGSDAGTGPRRVALNSSVENSLYGLQVGGRSEFNLFRRINGTLGTKFGLFYTDAKANRKITGNFADGSEYSPSIVNGTTSINGYNFGSGESDASFLAEIDLGLIYQLSQASRIRLGYRAIGLSGVAFASDNIPEDLANVTQLQETFDSRNLRLRGIYFSYELAF